MKNVCWASSVPVYTPIATTSLLVLVSETRNATRLEVANRPVSGDADVLYATHSSRVHPSAVSLELSFQLSLELALVPVSELVASLLDSLVVLESDVVCESVSVRLSTPVELDVPVSSLDSSLVTVSDPPVSPVDVELADSLASELVEPSLGPVVDALSSPDSSLSGDVVVEGSTAESLDSSAVLEPGPLERSPRVAEPPPVPDPELVTRGSPDVSVIERVVVGELPVVSANLSCRAKHEVPVTVNATAHAGARPELRWTPSAQTRPGGDLCFNKLAANRW